MSELGKLLVIAGAMLVVIGALLWSGVGRGWLGRMPGDINYSRNNFSFHFPIVTCIILSILLTVLLRLFRKYPLRSMGAGNLPMAPCCNKYCHGELENACQTRHRISKFTAWKIRSWRNMFRS